MSKLYGSVRIQKHSMNKSHIRGGRNGVTKYFKSYKQQMEHDFRIEKMDSNYLKRPNEKNKYHSFQSEKVGDIINQWEKIKSNHKKKKGKSIQKQTKEVISGLISFSKDFDLSEEDRIKQFEIVKQFVKEEFDYPIYCVQHNDEKALHYQFCFLNYDNKTNRPLAKQINTFDLQDKVFDYLKKYNVDYGHSRGIPKEKSNSENRSIMEGKVKELEEENEKLKTIQEELLNNITGIVNTFIELGMTYKKKTPQELSELVKRYVSNDKIEKLINTLEKITLKSNLDNSQKLKMSELMDKYKDNIQEKKDTKPSINK